MPEVEPDELATDDVESSTLRSLIERSLTDQGFAVHHNCIALPKDLDKKKIRDLHRTSVQYRIERATPGLRRHEQSLIARIASGDEVSPLHIAPKLIEVEPDSQDELLFRYAALHWSIPVSSGYGRRLRFLIIDDYNNKLIGIFGLGDPVFSLGPRDRFVGWDIEARRQRLRYVLDAYALGAVPPYSFLLAGKLVALLAISDNVRHAFTRKYERKSSLISGREQSGEIAMITTTSALGRSSLYNRIALNRRLLLEPVGYTSGSGDFQFSNGLYSRIYSFAERRCKPTAKQPRWGTGFRNRREVVRKVLGELGLSTDLQYHGIRRQVYVARLAENAKEFLCGESDQLEYFDLSADLLIEWFRQRWFLRRASWDHRYRQYDSASFRLWR